MHAKKFSAVFVLLLAVFIMKEPLAQPVRGVFYLNSDDLFASTSNEEGFVFVQAHQGESSFNAFTWAALNIFNFSTGESKGCFSENIDFRINNPGTTLYFITEEGFNCDVGEPVQISCPHTSDEATFSNGHGVAKTSIGQYTVHSRIETFNNLACELTAFGDSTLLLGSATKQRFKQTP